MQLWERSDIGYVQVIQTHFSSLMTFLVRHMTLADYLVLADRRVEKQHAEKACSSSTCSSSRRNLRSGQNRGLQISKKRRNFWRHSRWHPSTIKSFGPIKALGKLMSRRGVLAQPKNEANTTGTPVAARLKGVLSPVCPLYPSTPPHSAHSPHSLST